MNIPNEIEWIICTISLYSLNTWITPKAPNFEHHLRRHSFDHSHTMWVEGKVGVLRVSWVLYLAYLWNSWFIETRVNGQTQIEKKKEFWTEAVTFKHSGNSLRLTVLLGFRYSNTIHISFFVVLLLGLCALWQWPINHMPEDFGFQRTNNKSVHINKNKKANSQKMFMIRDEKKRKETEKNGQARYPSAFPFLQRI